METLIEAKQHITNHRHKGVDCPTCGQYVKLYKRPLNSTMAASLISVWRHAKLDFIHVNDYLITVPSLKKKTLGGGDFAKLRHWGLIAPKVEMREDGCKHNGHFRVTQKGEDFIKGKLMVSSHIFIFNNKFEGYNPEGITIQQALGKHFNFNELMAGI
jgi:hypothetical protein